MYFSILKKLISTFDSSSSYDQKFSTEPLKHSDNHDYGCPAVLEHRPLRQRGVSPVVGTLQQPVRSRTGGQLPISLLQPEGHGMQALKQLVDIYKDIDVSMHTMYGDVIHNRWNAFDQNWARLQERLNQYLSSPCR
jgi:hypothetical protein